MKNLTLLLIVILLACNPVEKYCEHWTDITRAVIQECCARGPGKVKRVCKCMLDSTLTNSGLSAKEKKALKKQACN